MRGWSACADHDDRGRFGRARGVGAFGVRPGVLPVIPAEAGIQPAFRTRNRRGDGRDGWAPAFAGVTTRGGGRRVPCRASRVPGEWVPGRLCRRLPRAPTSSWSGSAGPATRGTVVVRGMRGWSACADHDGRGRFGRGARGSGCWWWRPGLLSVIPAEAGIQPTVLARDRHGDGRDGWAPAFAGVTTRGGGRRVRCRASRVPGEWVPGRLCRRLPRAPTSSWSGSAGPATRGTVVVRGMRGWSACADHDGRGRFGRGARGSGCWWWRPGLLSVIPAEAGIQPTVLARDRHGDGRDGWAPAFAGVTTRGGGRRVRCRASRVPGEWVPGRLCRRLPRAPTSSWSGSAGPATHGTVVVHGQRGWSACADHDDREGSGALTVAGV